MKSTLSRRAFLKIAVSSSGAMALAACAAQPPAAPVAQEPAAEPAVAGPTEAPPAPEPTLAAPSAEEAVVVEAWVQEASIPPQKKVSEDFMAANPNIKINFVPTTLADTATKLLASIAAKRPSFDPQNTFPS